MMQDLSGPKIRTGTLIGGAPIDSSPATNCVGEGDGPGEPGLIFTPSAN